MRRRTGHTSEEIRRYDQDSEELRRIDPDDWVPLVFAIPELSPLDAIGRALSALCTAVTPPRPTDDEEDIVSHFAALRASNPLHGMSEALKEALARASVLPEPPHGDPHCPGIAPEMVGAAGFAKTPSEGRRFTNDPQEPRGICRIDVTRRNAEGRRVTGSWATGRQRIPLPLEVGAVRPEPARRNEKRDSYGVSVSCVGARSADRNARTGSALHVTPSTRRSSEVAKVRVLSCGIPRG